MEEFRSEKVTLSSLDNKNKDGPQLTSEALYLRELTDQIKGMREEIKELQDKLESASAEVPKAKAATPSSEKEAVAKEKTSADTKAAAKEKPEEAKEKKSSWLSDIGFIVLIIVIIGGAFMLRASFGGKPFTLAGFSAFTVLTSSMEDVIPKDSLVITKSTDPNVLQIGDDITYMSGPSSTITHRIIGIQENYAQTNARGFETKGTMNPEPDKEIVPAANVVGKVIWHSALLGKIANLIRKNWPYILFVMIVLTILMSVLRKVDEEDDPEDDPESKQTDEKKTKKKKKEKKKE